MASGGDEILRVEDLKVHFPVSRGALWRRQAGSVKAVDGVSFSLRRGETLGLVGESGCGKSTTGLALIKMLAATSGRIVFDGTDFASFDKADERRFRRSVQMVYQDPFGSLNPRMRVRDIVGEPLEVHGLARDKAAYRARVAELLEMVGLLPYMADRYPHEFSGGQRQRVGIARALAAGPSLIVCDEPVSALDVSIQAQVVNIFMALQRRLGLTYVFIAHDLAVVRHISDRIAVMYLGRIVEIAGRDELYDDPQHPYTRALLSAVPVASVEAERQRTRIVLQGEVPSPLNPPTGCRFHPRCPAAMARCRSEDPALLPRGGSGRMVACHLQETVSA
ncbi:ABC transporter ATP-binding protein [Cupriavidus malaysiensis]|uniref:Peptide ABC transporter ATP-binding protein n=1 Tax=Cupriavidus malaysiensis TaxID=367825 RepID=A0ABM6FDQ2_9BURK|nr:dipeptide ABC transporter ATP-binding protein [Cupriavidus malaysiensis]AOZ09941.1 peptide ABC transporter ATP-binding protein [Cupriavidus malaysiensis]